MMLCIYLTKTTNGSILGLNSEMKMKMKLPENIKKFIKRYLAPTAIIGSFGFGIYGYYSHLEKQKITKEKARIEKLQQDSIKKATQTKIQYPVLNIAYRNDTLENSGTALYLYYAGKITRYYVEHDDRYKLQLPYLAHEEWHHHNTESGFRYKYYYSPVDYYKLCMHNEISANIAAILTARYEYLAAPNKKEKQKIINRYKNTYMKFYFSEVAKGNIKPESKLQEDIIRERHLIANGTLNMWMNKFSGHYRSSFYAMLQTYVKNIGLVPNHKKNYEHILNYMYTIGGVNFADYFEKDITLKEDKVLIAEQLPKIRFMKAGNIDIMNIVNQNYHLMQQVGIDKQTEIFENLLISSQLKYMLRHKTEEEIKENPQLVNLCYRKIMNKVYTDRSFTKVVASYPLLSINRSHLKIKDTDFESIARQMYQFKGMDLTTMITDFSANNVPIHTKFEQGFENNKTKGLFYLFPQMSAQLEKILEPKQSPKLSPLEPKKETKTRVSEIMRINLPNLREPILLHATPQDEELIFAKLREFEQIPDVFKCCNTAAQRNYLKKHKEYIDSLKNFQSTGSIDISPMIKNKIRTK